LIFYIKLRKPFCSETRNFDVEAEQQSYIKICVELSMTHVQTWNLLKLNESSRTLVYPSLKEMTDKVLYESERRWWTAVGFHGKINVSNVWAVKEWCASESWGNCVLDRHRSNNNAQNINCRFKNGENFLHEKWVARQEKCVCLNGE
jgi:hypothetical protein